jgi:excinuclease UvrABC nuclease subunit
MIDWHYFKEELDLAPNTKGVYILADDHHNVVFIETAKDIKKELSRQPDPQNYCLLGKNIQYFAFQEDPNPENRKAKLVSQYNPECNND